MKRLIALLLAGLMLFPTTIYAKEEVVTQFMDCFDPMPIVEELKDDVWGAELVGPRDQGNGLEDKIIESGSFSYWDGGIIKDDETGKYYLYGSQWDQSGGHNGWKNSYGIGAVSDNLYGPYEKMEGYLWPDNKSGKGHNVFPFTLKKDDPYGKYAIINSDNGRQGDIFVSDSLTGGWKYLTSITSNMTGSGFNCVNVAVFLRPDGKYQALARHGDIAIADDLKGPWTLMVDCLWDQVPGLPYTDSDGGHRLEDPTMWYSNGMYHIVVNHWKERKAYYLTSEDGITNWRLHEGSAYEPDADFLRYTDGMVNHWNKIERPYAYVEDGELKAFTFAVIDSSKENDKGNDQHGSKVIVVPFNSDKLDTLIDNEYELFERKGIAPVADSNTQSWRTEMPYNYGGNTYMRVQVNNTDAAYGELGEKIAGGDGTDCKIGYLKYDVSDFKLDKVKKATLSFVYRKRLVGSGDTDKIKVVLAENTWDEGKGSDILGKTAGANDITWANSPKLIYDEDSVCYSKEFNTNEAFQVVEVDVTKLVKSVDAESENISFAFTGSTQGNTLSFLTKELGEGYSVLLNMESEPGIKVDGIKSDDDGILVTKGERRKLNITVYPENADDTSVMWETTNESICYVDNDGYLNAVGAGKASVTATTKDGGYSATIEVTVC
ncbi:MAG: Ig-like domain-containing protein, partial [Clostridia bacterium]|nr:Ig-like domain-containing protein [Clostridia bacterium]